MVIKDYADAAQTTKKWVAAGPGAATQRMDEWENGSAGSVSAMLSYAYIIFFYKEMLNKDKILDEPSKINLTKECLGQDQSSCPICFLIS